MCKGEEIREERRAGVMREKVREGGRGGGRGERVFGSGGKNTGGMEVEIILVGEGEKEEGWRKRRISLGRTGNGGKEENGRI